MDNLNVSKQESPEKKPWLTNIHHFQTVQLSTLAVLKMLKHTEKGGRLEVMGLMLGHYSDSNIIITDSFMLPVHGTETRVNAASEAYEFVISHTEYLKKVGNNENVIGWYHSHPGYGCWLSGIDVDTQMLYQQFQDPFVAIVIDPLKTIEKEEINIGAFRTYPKDSQIISNISLSSSIDHITDPTNKIRECGAHYHKYYELEIVYTQDEQYNLNNYISNSYTDDNALIHANSIHNHQNTIMELSNFMDNTYNKVNSCRYYNDDFSKKIIKKTLKTLSNKIEHTSLDWFDHIMKE